MAIGEPNVPSRIVGADPSKNDLVFVVADGAGVPVPDDLDRLQLAEHGLHSERLLDLARRVESHMRRISPEVVSMYGSTRGNWSLNDLRPRACLEAALMIGTATAGVDAVEVSPHDAARTFHVKFNKVPQRVRELVDLSSYSNAPRRARALAGVWHAAGLLAPEPDHGPEA